MKENKETIRDAMDRRLSFLDARPSCRGRVMQRIAQEEEPKVKKKMSIGLVFALVLMSLSAIALASGLLFAPRVDAARLADRALLETYGVTDAMQTYFVRETQELGDGTIRVTYTGWDRLACALGTYTVDVKGGRAAASWSHDGVPTAGGYDADAWGAEQLRQMLADNAETGDMSRFAGRADAIAEAQGQPWEDPVSTEEEREAWGERMEREKTAALEARVLSEDEMRASARQAIVERYGLTEAQAALLELYELEWDDSPNAWYRMYEGQPCFEAQYFLDQDPDHPGTHVEKDGAYAALVNVVTGVIEEIVYESGLGGEG